MKHMTNLVPKDNSKPQDSEKSPLVQFLETIGKKTDDPVHLRLLKVCQNENPAEKLEAELGLIISEIIDEN